VCYPPDADPIPSFLINLPAVDESLKEPAHIFHEKCKQNPFKLGLSQPVDVVLLAIEADSRSEGILFIIKNGEEFSVVENSELELPLRAALKNRDAVLDFVQIHIECGGNNLALVIVHHSLGPILFLFNDFLKSGGGGGGGGGGRDGGLHPSSSQGKKVKRKHQPENEKIRKFFHSAGQRENGGKKSKH